MSRLHYVLPHQSSPSVSQYLGGDNEDPTSQEGDIPLIERLDNIHNTNRISRPAPEGTTRISKNGYQHMLLHVKRARVERKGPGPEPWDSELGPGQHGRHEVTNGQGGDLDSDLGYDQGLRPVRKELV
uniref:Uncharacterized protein n=1 Tax=Opuntia streptacantha TaxID=393608 RepID=A0A7C9DZ28_OPUST